MPNTLTNDSSVATRDSLMLRTGRTLYAHPSTLFLGALGTLYLTTLAVNHSEAEDAVVYIRQVTDGSLEDLFHPNHLLFNAASRVLYVAARTLGYDGSAELPMQLLNLTAALASLALCMRIGERLHLARSIMLLAASATALSFGFWWYAVEGETYVLPLPCLLFAFERMLSLFQTPRWSDALSFSLALALGTLLHQQHALAALVLFAALALARINVRLLATATALYATLVLGSYAAIGRYVHGHEQLAALVRWPLGHAHDGAWTPFTAASPLKALVGLGRAVSGLHMLFGFASFERAAQRMWPNKLLVEERFLVDDTSVAVLIGYALLLGVLALAGLRLSWLAARSAKADTARAFRRTVLAYLLAYACFNTWWEPQNVEFWVAVLPLLFLLVAVRLNHAPRRTVLAYGSLFVFALGLSNLLGSILPQTSRAHDYWYAMNRPLFAVTREGDVVVTNGGYISDAYLSLYGKAEVFSVARFDHTALLRELDAHDGRVFVSSWVREPLFEVKATGMVTERRELFSALEAHGTLVERARSPGQTVYQWITAR